MGSGQCDVKRYNRRLRELIRTGSGTPSFIVSHELGLDEAPDAYKHFDARDNGWTKVVLHPGRTAEQRGDQPQVQGAAASPAQLPAGVDVGRLGQSSKASELTGAGNTRPAEGL